MSRSVDQRKLRLIHFVVQPVLVWDNGEELAPGPQIEPQAVTLAGLRELAENWDAKLDEIYQRAESVK